MKNRDKKILFGALVVLVAALLSWSVRRQDEETPKVTSTTPPMTAAPERSAQSDRGSRVLALSNSAVPSAPASSVTVADSGSSTDAGIVFRSPLHRCTSLELCGADGICLPTPSGSIGCFASNCGGPFDKKSCGGVFDSCVEIRWGKKSIYRCAPGGEGQSGATCYDSIYAPDSKRCSPGLACIAGFCAEPCDSSGSCKGDHECSSSDAGLRACVPKGLFCTRSDECHNRACVDGICLVPASFESGKKSCLPGSCESGFACAGIYSGHDGFGRCRPDCTDSRQCAEGSTCVSAGPLTPDRWVCERVCVTVDDCAQEESCRTRAGAASGFCQSAMPNDMTGSAQAIGEELWRSPDYLPKN